MCLWGTQSATLLSPLRMSRPTVRPLVDSINGWCFTNINAAPVTGSYQGQEECYTPLSVVLPASRSDTHTEPRGIENTFVLHVQPTSYNVGLPISAPGATSHMIAALWSLGNDTLLWFSFWSCLPYGSWALCPCESSLLLSLVSDVGLRVAVPSGSSL